MAKIIYICSRKPLSPEIESKLNVICSKLSPDNITPKEPLIYVSNDSAYAVLNPTVNFLKNNSSILLGQLFGDEADWYVPEAEYPDGSYALFRDGDDLCEIISDAAASRTIWYYHDENILIASTSQRAIILYLRSFEFNENVIPWMLSTGSLGPGLSWDKRIKCIPPGSSVLLNKIFWTFEHRTNSLKFKTEIRSDFEHEDLLMEVLKNIFISLKADLSNWSLPLSGGYDSRGILLFLLSSGKKIKNTVTWALNSSQNKNSSEASIAKELSDKYSIENIFYPTDTVTEESLEVLFERFLQNGEGRIDYFSGFAEGFKIWKNIFEQGTEGIFSGDECFGGSDISSALTLRRTLGFCLCSDFSNLKDAVKFGIPEQISPENFRQINNESLDQWRDRLFREFRLPVILSAVTDLKLSYIEQISPLLSHKILKLLSGLPDHLRKDKFLFRKIISSLSPYVRFKTDDSDSVPRDIYNDPELIMIIKKELNTSEAHKIFAEDFLSFVINGINSAPSAKSLSFSTLKKLIPRSVKNFLRDKASLPDLDPNVLAFRVYILVKMNNILLNDS